jgi:glucose-6-phosphate isomerase
VQGSGPSQDQHDLALANMLAQARALSDGDEDGSGGYPGNRPSTTLLFQKLDPETLGKLVALYEHKVFVESVVWGINAFDQPGVELGKRLAREMTGAVTQPDGFQGGDAGTRGLLDAISRWR